MGYSDTIDFIAGLGTSDDFIVAYDTPPPITELLTICYGKGSWFFHQNTLTSERFPTKTIIALNVGHFVRVPVINLSLWKKPEFFQKIPFV